MGPQATSIENLARTTDGRSFAPALDQAGTQPATGAVILVHGLGTDMHEHGRFDRLATRIAACGFDVVRFNFRGHDTGQDAGHDFSISGALLDYQAVLRWAAGCGYETLCVIGSSFGASIVLLSLQSTAAPPSLSSVIFLNPVVDYSIVWPGNRYGQFPCTLPADAIENIERTGRMYINGFLITAQLLSELREYKPYLSAPLISCPTLILHGSQDVNVPAAPILDWFSDAPDTTMEIVPGATHAFKEPRFESMIHERILSFLSAT